MRLRSDKRMCTLAILGCLVLGLATDGRGASVDLAHRTLGSGKPLVENCVSWMIPAVGVPMRGHFVFFSAEDEADEQDDENNNLYLAPKGLSPDKLIAFILDMEEKPRSIQKREGFSEAIVEAADRILASKTEPAYHRIATLSKFAVLHKEASFGNQDADKQLEQFVEEVKDSEDKRVMREVVFLQLERKALNSGDLSLEEVQKLLEELNEYFASEKLGEKHLRIASGTVRAINRLDSDDPAEKEKYGDLRETYFAQFGKLFAKSENKQLAAYGKKLAK